MLPAPQSGTREAAAPNSSTPNRGRGRGKRDGYPFLTKEELSSSKKKCKVLDVRLQADNYRPGSQLVALKLAFEGQMRLFWLRPTHPAYQILVDAWTQDENNWVNRNFFASLEVQEFDGSTQIRFEPEEGETGNGKPKTRKSV